jgi:hypothetical protein
VPFVPANSITLTPVTGGDMISAVEAMTTLLLSGTSNGIAPGTLISILVDGSSTPAAYSSAMPAEAGVIAGKAGLAATATSGNIGLIPQPPSLVVWPSQTSIHRTIRGDA